MSSRRFAFTALAAILTGAMGFPVTASAQEKSTAADAKTTIFGAIITLIPRVGIVRPF